MKRPIRSQLLTPLLALHVTAVLGIAACSAWINLSRSRTLLREREAEVVRVFDEATFPLTAPVLQQMTRLSGQQFVVWDPTGERIIETSFSPSPPGLEQRIAALRPGTDGEPAIRTLDWAADRYSVRVAQRKNAPELQVLVLTSHRTLAEAQWDAVWPPLAVGGGALLLLVPWLLALTRGWSRRIEHIQRSVAGIAAGDSAATADPPDCDDELAALVADIERMSQRLQELQAELIQSERERLVAQLAAGFAHQFRNGVAGASLALQLHASRCATTTDKSLAVAQKQLSLLESEIRGMLSLAKRTESPRESLRIADVVDQAVDLALPAIEHRRITLRNDSDPVDVIIEGSRDGLRAALLNLLLNAIDAAGPAGEIRVDTRPTGAGVTIAVRDNGAGPTPEVADRMTDAFVTTKPEGIGLGLTVVAAVAHDHRGRLSWRREEGWTAVELWIPEETPLAGADDE